VWIDHHEARIFHVEAGAIDESMVQAPGRHIHRHPKGPTAEHNHPDDQHRFFHEVADGLRDGDQILVLGPSTAKLQLLRFLHQHEQAMEKKIVGIETVDHPTDRQLVAYVRKYYREVGPA
jgi:stalled ribosome rescue protein Dom34